MLTFITGGIKSGKSVFGEKLAALNDKDVYYLATAVCTDNEMAKRIAVHRERRPLKWKTIEESYDLQEAFKNLPEKPAVILVDCLTTYISNKLWRDYPEVFSSNEDLPKDSTILSEMQLLAQELSQSKHVFIVVSNEVGMCLIPTSKIGRTFCDLQGVTNQIFAEYAQTAYLIVSGLEIKLK